MKMFTHSLITRNDFCRKPLPHTVALLLVFILLLSLCLSQRIILADSVPFSEYSEKVVTIDCSRCDEYAETIALLENFLNEKETYFSKPEYAWVKEFLYGNEKEMCDESVPSSEALNAFYFLSFSEEKAPQCLIKRLNEAIDHGKFVDFCEKFKFFVTNHQPQISYFVIEEFFYKHLNQPDLSPGEKLFNKQLHNLYLRDLYTSFEKFESKFNIKKNDFSDVITKIYFSSWQLQIKYNIPWEMAFQIALKDYWLISLFTCYFCEADFTDLFSAKSEEEYQDALIAHAEVLFPLYYYLEEYNSAQNMLSIVQYWHKTCLEINSVAQG